MLGDKFYSRASQAMGATGLRWTGKLNIPLYRLSGGRIGGRIADAPVLLLTTTGRKSGAAAHRPGRLPGRRQEPGGDRLQRRHTTSTPAWSLNLKANPAAEVEVGRDKRQVRARIAEGEERADLWSKHNDQYSGFDEYEARTTRDIALSSSSRSLT